MLKWLFSKLVVSKKNMTYMGFRNGAFVLSNLGGFIPIYKLTEDLAVDVNGEYIDISDANVCVYFKSMYPNEPDLQSSLNATYSEELSNVSDKDFETMARKVGNVVAIMNDGTSTTPMPRKLGKIFFNKHKRDIKTMHRV